MDERLRETLSAMVDDEADELSVRRVLSHPEQAEVRAQWQRWQQIHDLMHDQAHGVGTVDIAAGVRARLDGTPERASEAAASVSPRRTGSTWHWPAVAMIGFALIVGFGAGSHWDALSMTERELAALASEAAAPSVDTAESVVQEVALQGLDEQQLRLMRQYMLEHAQHNSVGAGGGSVGYARMVSANSGY